MVSHITAVNHEVMQLFNLCSFNPCCDEVVLTSIEVGERLFITPFKTARIVI